MLFLVKDTEDSTVFVECPEGAMAGSVSGQINEWLRAYESDLRVRVVRENRADSAETDGPDWRDRERQHDNSTIPWIEERWWLDSEYADLHFPHVSEDRPNMIAYTPSVEYGEADRQVRVSPGKYLNKYFGDGRPLWDWNIRDFVTEYMATNAAGWIPELKLHRSPDEIEAAYTTTPPFGSCMAYEASNFDSSVHPVRVYGAGDLAVATVEDQEGETLGRCLVWPDRKVHSRIYAEDSTPMLSALKAEGYTDGNMAGAKLLRIEDYRGSLVCPYIDGDATAVEDYGDHLVIGYDGMWADSTNGLLSTTCCDECGDPCHEEDGRYGPDDVFRCDYCHCDMVGYCQDCYEDHMAEAMVEGPDGEYRCEYCHEDRFVSCGTCGDFVDTDDALDGPDGETRCPDCHGDEVTICDSCKDDILVEDSTEGPDYLLRCADCHDDEVDTCESCGVDHMADLGCEDCLTLELA